MPVKRRNYFYNNYIFFYYACVLIFGVFLAFRTRKALSAFKESRYIAFSIYSVAICAGIGCIVTFGVLKQIDPRIDFSVLSFTILVSLTATFFLLFSKKIQVIYFQPENNVRKSPINSKEMHINLDTEDEDNDIVTPSSDTSYQRLLSDTTTVELNTQKTGQQ